MGFKDIETFWIWYAKKCICGGVEGCLFLCVCVYFIRWSRESMTPKNKNHDLKGQFCMLLLSLDLSSYRILNWGYFRSWESYVYWNSRDTEEKKLRSRQISGSQTRPVAFMGVGGGTQLVCLLSNRECGNIYYLQKSRVHFTSKDDWILWFSSRRKKFLSGLLPGAPSWAEVHCL